MWEDADVSEEISWSCHVYSSTAPWDVKDGHAFVVLIFRPGGKLADAAAGVDVLSAPG